MGLGPPYTARDEGRQGAGVPPEAVLGGLPWGAGPVHPSPPHLAVVFLRCPPKSHSRGFAMGAGAVHPPPPHLAVVFLRCPPKSRSRGSAVGCWSCALPTAPAHCGFSPVAKFAGWANVPGAASPALPALAVSDVTLGTESEKNCPWFLSVPAGKRRLGSSGGRGDACQRGSSQAPSSLPARRLRAASHGGSAEPSFGV